MVVNVNVGLPDVAPAVTAPPLVTVAIPVLLLIQVPPVVGDKVVVPPLAHMDVAPVMLTLGNACTVTVVCAPLARAQPVPELV